MSHERSASIDVTRVLGFFFAFLVLTYGSLSVWLGHGGSSNPLKKAFCAAWLCPIEYPPGRIFELERDSRFPDKRLEAIHELKLALSENPASAYAWANLGEALVNTGQGDVANYSLRQAVAAAPKSPAILARAANVALSTRHYAEVVTYLRPILMDPGVPKFYPAVFLTYSRTPLSMQDLLTGAIPTNSWSAQSFLRFLISSGRTSDAQSAWEWIVEHGFQDDQLVAEYVQFLVSHQQEQAAATAWARLNAKRQPEYRTRNWIFDGGFEQTQTPVQLDWQIQSSDDVEVSKSDQAQQGKSSIQLNFGGLENVQFEGIQQEAVLFPGKWRVGAFARTDGLTTDQGIAVRIVDPVQSRRLDVSTEALTGTHGWTKLERVFDVSPQTRLVRVEIFRSASSQFDNKVAGKAWIDGVELTPVR